MPHHFHLIIRLSAIQVLMPLICTSLNSSQREEILTLHNRFRHDIATGRQGANVSNMNELAWSQTLEQTAESLLTCSRNVVHNDDNFLMPMINYGRYRMLNITKILRFWHRESRHYVPEAADCIPWDSCNRYRAMVGADRERVGCSLRQCPRRQSQTVYVLMCLYEGGDPDSFKYKEGPACTRCGDALSFCHRDLCVACLHSQYRTCECRKTCFREGVGSGTLNRATCSCNCTYGLGPNCDEECRNPELYADYDYCATVSREDCSHPDVGELLGQSCPEQCVCRKHPSQT
ncbi:cysteine-rich secretory protein LCCL domain-containing 2-like isoform X1 [Haliotis asinina]|uniref:cysteine-rich secretory protein LCCL domain-containing 2-like isoform X1 n=1 Tax=Haliotis asinina TaxID=109174 RepID=UPI00353242EB